MTTWKIKESDPTIIKRLMEEFRAPEIIARVMANRGLKSLTNSKTFFNPMLENLHDPFLMNNMDKAANVLQQNIINKKKIFREINYQHPLFSTDSILAQRDIRNIQGRQRVYFSGAWLRYGFHEDGILSSKTVINKLLEDDGTNEGFLRVL